MDFTSERKKEIISFLQQKYPKKIISESDLRMEQVLINTTNSYEFNILRESGSDVITEKKLDKNDNFFVSHLGIFIAAQDQTAIGKEVLQTYPNPVVFAAVAGPPAFDPADLERVYRGNLDIKIGTKTYIESLNTGMFRDVPQSQQTAEIAGIATGIANSQRKYFDGFQPWNNLEFSGASDTRITVTIPLDGTVALQAQAANINNKLIFAVHGFLIKGGARG